MTIRHMALTWAFLNMGNVVLIYAAKLSIHGVKFERIAHFGASFGAAGVLWLEDIVVGTKLASRM